MPVIDADLLRKALIKKSYPLISVESGSEHFGLFLTDILPLLGYAKTDEVTGEQFARWLTVFRSFSFPFKKCSSCGCEFDISKRDIKKFRFCPNCGKSMLEGC